MSPPLETTLAAVERTRIRAAGALASLLFGVLVLLAATPLFTHGAIAAAVHLAFAGLCHQDAARSFVHDGAQMAICHRCTGIYAGLALGALAVALGLRPSPRSKIGWISAVFALGGQVALGWVAPGVFDHAPLRVASGLAFGAWSGAAVVVAIAARSMRPSRPK